MENVKLERYRINQVYMNMIKQLLRQPSEWCFRGRTESEREGLDERQINRNQTSQ